MKEKQRILTWDKKEWVSRFEELPRISLSRKLCWLKKQGFDFNKICLIDLRNAIGHMNFDIIDSNGTIRLVKYGKKYTREDMKKALDNMFKLMRITSDIRRLYENDN